MSKAVLLKKPGGNILPPPTDPTAVAKKILPKLGHLHHWRGDWYCWNGRHWFPVQHELVNMRLRDLTEHARYKGTDGRSGATKLIRWSPTPRKLQDLRETLSELPGVFLPDEVEPGTWLDGRSQSSSDTYIPFYNGILNVDQMVLEKNSPSFFNLSAIEFPYDEQNTMTQEWDCFLKSVWPNDQESIDTLQEMMGYIVSGFRGYQKIFALIGPTRSGKGTIARVMQGLVGDRNVCGPTLRSMSTNFGLSPLIGKKLALVPDSRMPRGSDGVMENLNMISGQDAITIDRKYKDLWHGVIQAQIVIMSNEIPSFSDSSNAISGRMLVLEMRKSFLGQEDPNLGRKLEQELTGILNWALVGLDRLQGRGYFKEPKSSRDMVRMMRESASPITRFVEEECVVGPGEKAAVAEVYDRYAKWSEVNGWKNPMNRDTFGRQLKEAFPEVFRKRFKRNGIMGYEYQGLSLI